MIPLAGHTPPSVDRVLIFSVLMLAGHTPLSVDRKRCREVGARDNPARTRGKMTELLLSLPIKSPRSPVSLSHAAYWSILA